MNSMSCFNTIRALTLLALLPLGACVSQGQYDQMSDSTKRYQRSLHDLEQYQAQLEAENQRLRGEVALYEGKGTLEAGYTADIDARMKALEAMLAGSGTQAGDVTMFEIEGGYGYSVKESVLFDSGSAELRKGGVELLLALATDFQARPFRRVWVRGHTDTDPIKKPETLQKFPRGNLELSVERALTVSTLLIEKAKIDNKRVCVAGFGASEPVAPNDNAANKQKNRRVEIFVLDDESSVASPASSLPAQQ